MSALPPAAAAAHDSPLRVAHFYVQSQNLGDRGSALGIQTLLRQFDPTLRFAEFNLDRDCIWSGTLPRLQALDGLIVGGGGLLYNHPTHASGWYLHCSYRNYRRLRLPTCLFAPGLNAEHSAEPRWVLKRSTVRSIARFAAATHLVGVRDLRTLAFMLDIGVRHAQWCPCPSMFVEPQGDPPADAGAILGINLTTRSTHLAALDRVLATLADFARACRLQPVFVVHYPYEDAAIVRLAQGHGIAAFESSSPGQLMRFYQSCRAVVGMRGHCLLYATGAAVPMLAIAYNVKCDAHMEMLDMPAQRLPATVLQQPATLISHLEQLLAQREQLQGKLVHKREHFRLLASAFAAQFLQLLLLGKRGRSTAPPPLPSLSPGA